MQKLSASDEPTGGAKGAIDQKKVKFLKFDAQKKLTTIALSAWLQTI
jgi:hypothetical protein